MTYPLVLGLIADGIPLAVTCRVLGFTPQAFHAWRKDPVSQRDWDGAHLINAALDIHHDDPAFGYRFIADELAAQGIAAGANRVAQAVQGAAHLVGVRQGTGPGPPGPARPCMTTT
ncbi:hypothetical protein GCM10010169_34900 [Micromonospora fulviviridis]|uniref:transposase n=1 Tax=Micromonospora fulviviridis TaxID=47860 RepID=UPI001669C238|nr:hypothetical protein GCM10010169_34900 [Micromonospora fulviviridis]